MKPSMTPTQQAAHDAALESSDRNLQQACHFAALHATAKPLFQRTMRRAGALPVLVRFAFPGVLQVSDPETGDLVAISEPGKPHLLGADFAHAAGGVDAQAATFTLQQACRFAALHATAKALFQRTMHRQGSLPVLVRLVFPGVLQVSDPATGDLVALSEPGEPDMLSADFVPSAWVAFTHP